MLKVLPPDAELTLELIDAGSPALFRSGANYSYLVDAADVKVLRHRDTELGA